MEKKPELSNTNDHNEDYFKRFMFGNRGDTNNKKEEFIKNSEAQPDVQKNISRDEWLFGKRNADHLGKEENRPIDRPQLEKLMNNVNVEELMNNIDELVTSISHIKPLWKKVGPLVNKLRKQ
jgi:hypothetical protein